MATRDAGTPGAPDAAAPVDVTAAPATPTAEDAAAPTTAVPTAVVPAGGAPTMVAPAVPTAPAAPAVPVRLAVSAEGLRLVWRRDGMIEMHGTDLLGHALPDLYQDCEHYRAAVLQIRDTVTHAQAAIFSRVCPPGSH